MKPVLGIFARFVIVGTGALTLALKYHWPEVGVLLVLFLVWVELAVRFGLCRVRPPDPQPAGDEYEQRATERERRASAGQ